jgi:uncharacterized membrane protein YkvA (DUF1232 family)
MSTTVAPRRAKTAVLPLLLRPRATLRFLMDGRAPKLPKALLLGAVAYTLLPLDLVPDLVPILGWLDDAGVMTAAMAWLLRAVARYEAEAPAPDTTIDVTR